MTTANGIVEEADVEELIARIMRKKFPALALLSVRTYRVVKVYGGIDYGRCDLALDADPEQQIPRVDQWPGIPGGVGLPAVGSLCEVTWRDGDQKSPVIVGFQPLRATGGLPDEVKIDATLLRLGPSADHVQLAPGPTAILSGVARIGDTVTLSGITITAPVGTMGGPCVVTAGAIVLTGTITSGSVKVTSA